MEGEGEHKRLLSDKLFQHVILDRPPDLLPADPCFSATATYMAKRTAAGGLIVMEVVTLSRGFPQGDFHIFQAVNGHAALATSPRAVDCPNHIP